MSYIITLRRSLGKPISAEEVHSVIEHASDLELESAPSEVDEVLFRWTGGEEGSPLDLLFSRGEIETATTPSNAALRRLQRLAEELNASLFGEEGEDLSDVDVPDIETAKASVWGAVAVVAFVVALLIWWLA